MKDLKEYYESVIYLPGMPDFAELPADAKKEISNTLAFAVFQFNKAFDELKCAVIQAVKDLLPTCKKK